MKGAGIDPWAPRGFTPTEWDIFCSRLDPPRKDPSMAATIVHRDGGRDYELGADESCTLCGTPVGWVLDEAVDGQGVAGKYWWREYFEVTVDGDDPERPTRFCEDCYDWFDQAAEAFIANRPNGTPS